MMRWALSPSSRLGAAAVAAMARDLSWLAS
jgi:hypothetical protein